MRAYASSVISPLASSFGRQCQVPGVEGGFELPLTGLLGRSAYQPKARETDRSIGGSNTSREADSPVVEVSDREITDLPTAAKE
jgi:hypothetical protein